MNPLVDKLDQLLDVWEENREHGRDVSAEELTDDPALLSLLSDRIRAMKEMDWLDVEQETVSLTSSPSDTGKCRQKGFESCVPWLFAQRYTLESLIAGGGFAQVWRAYDRRLERHVAVKISKVDTSAEAKRVAKLQHPGIIAVHDLGEEQGFWFIVFDLIEGIDLAQMIEEDPPTWQEAVRIVADVADYVQHAHEQGFVHRDIKPANILIKSDGRPTLADFGISITEEEMNNDATTTSGTLAYMAPELLTGEGKADVTTDVYGLGVVLFQTLNRELPFKGKNFYELRQRILSGECPKWIDGPEKIPQALKDITKKCLSKRSENRFQSAGELARALRDLIKPPCAEKK